MTAHKNVGICHKFEIIFEDIFPYNLKYQISQEVAYIRKCFFWVGSFYFFYVEINSFKKYNLTYNGN